jgi:two-component system phosphate regulon sensor histidine kinase PhoR
MQIATANPGEIQTTPVPIGLMRNPVYHAVLYQPGAFLARKMLSQVLFSVLLVALTLVSFIFIFRNLLRQKRLTESKNEFISNITHELKTPISTVAVAIEAMRNFNVLQNPQKAGEYLDIADQELKRLSLLVDKVLRLSMFEKKALELSTELVKLDEVVEEVMKSMRLQFEKQNAKVGFTKKGKDFSMMGDHLHMASVVYNLLDNALKYNGDNIEIQISLEDETRKLRLEFTDNCIGIPAAYRDKVFEKFFRVPAGDRHNVKGYGLGLSYVSHIVEKHGGKIGVESEPGKFTRFIIEIPKEHGQG